MMYGFKLKGLNTSFYRILFHLCFVFALPYSGFSQTVICTAQANGAWNNPASWSCGAVPACGDSVIIPAAYTITITTQQDYSGCASGPDIVIYGVLKFTNGNKLKLPCDARIYIMPGGSVQPGSGGGNSNLIEICNEVVWSAGDGPVSGPSCMPTTSEWCNSVVLPVELLYFSGEAKDGYVDLAWSTATEKNNCCFDVERSVDAISFSKSSSVASKAFNGTSNNILNYTCLDYSPLSNITYYRLKQIDNDNTFSYSNIISINYIKTKNVKFVIYPNPNKGEFTADISGIENNHEVLISLMNEKGKLVYHSSFFVQDQGSNKLQIIPENKLSSGIYLCILTIEDIQYHVKVVVS